MVNIRQARPADLEGLTALLKKLFSIEADFFFNEARQRQGLLLMMEDERGCLLVAEDDGAVMGMASGQVTISTAEGGPALLVEDVVVQDGWQGKGIGRRLLSGLGDWARERQIARLQLLADRNNAPALAFYRCLGWQQTELVCLRKRLGSS